jgi:hypothetical protein
VADLKSDEHLVEPAIKQAGASGIAALRQTGGGQIIQQCPPLNSALRDEAVVRL